MYQIYKVPHIKAKIPHKNLSCQEFAAKDFLEFSTPHCFHPREKLEIVYKKAVRSSQLSLLGPMKDPTNRIWWAL